MKKLAPAMLAAVVITQTGCPGCPGPYPPRHNNNRNARIAEGAWMLELDRVERDGRCRDVDPESLRRLHAFVEHRGQRGLFIDIEGIVTRGEQLGPDINTYGALEEEVILLEEEPRPGRDDEDTDYDSSEEDSDYDTGIEDTGEEDRDDREDREDREEEVAVDAPYYGVSVTLSGQADGPRWMSGNLFIDLFEEGGITCTLSARFSGYADDSDYAVID